MIVLKRPAGENFQLRPTILRQINIYWQRTGYRQVRRSDLRKFFKLAVHPGWDFIRNIAGKYYNSPWVKDEWYFIYRWADKTMSIGCQSFDAAETVKIRRWALAKRRRK